MIASTPRPGITATSATAPATPAARGRLARPPEERINRVTSIPFFLMHVLPLGALWTGATPFDWALCAALFFVRMFFITAGYHRYFAHRSFRTSRAMQLALAFGGGTAAQKGALWWAAHHRHHHRYSDQPEDVHSPRKGFWWSHAGWILCSKYDQTRLDRIPDLARYPELRFLDRWHWIPPVALGAACFLAGGWSALWIGFFLSTVFTYHATFAINSASHVFGRRRYATSDTSRNSLLLALLTLGEGWHNNHHYYQASANMGFYWWEIDVSYAVLRGLRRLGLVWDLRTPPRAVIDAKREGAGLLDVTEVAMPAPERA
jgi:stearoyl-CoA desaturase (delta-9 desaturase)